MKRLFALSLIALFVFFISETAAYTRDCWTHKKVQDGHGNKIWNQEGRCCVSSGINCVIVPCDDPSSLGTIEEQAAGGWIITANVSNIQLKRLENGTWINVTNSGANYTFSEPEKLIIDECDDYPQLEGLQLNLTGITTDNNGDFTVYIPELQ